MRFACYEHGRAPTIRRRWLGLATVGARDGPPGEGRFLRRGMYVLCVCGLDPREFCGLVRVCCGACEKTRGKYTEKIFLRQLGAAHTQRARRTITGK